MAPDRAGRRWFESAAALFLATLALYLAYAACTRSAWEDWYITFRASSNLVAGHGLVYNPGERVQPFSSPLTTIVAALLAWVAGPSDVRVLWLFRVISGAAAGLTAVLLWRIGAAMRLPRWPRLLLIALFVADAKTVEFSTSGMETAFLLLFLAGGIRAAIADAPSAVALGVSWAGLMWTRADGFVHGGAVAIGLLAFPPGGSRARLLKTYGRAVLVAAVLYAPWFLWSWHYYGSPVPQSALAKALDLTLPSLLARTVTYPLRVLAAASYGDTTFMPAFYFYGGWPVYMTALADLAIVAAFYWLVPIAARPARAFSVAFVVSHFYVSVVTPNAPWYFPPATLLGYAVLACAMADVSARVRWAATATKAASAGVVAFSLMVTVFAAREMRAQQRLIEDATRKAAGLWLREHRRSDTDTVFLEPLGYIGYFSALKTYDYPGLSSPEVVRARREVGDDWAALIPRLRPDWLVLRAAEVTRLDVARPGLLTRDYAREAVFDASEPLTSYRWLPGRQFLWMDRRFEIYRRR